jgi:hypothetical protein
MILKKILYYINPLTLFKKNNHNLNLRFMHGMNRISIIMFIIALIIIIKRLILK